MQTKKCTKCGRELPITEFYVNKTSKDGHHPYCKECFNRVSSENRKKRKQRQAEEENAKAKAKENTLPWEAILNLPEEQDVKELANAMNQFKSSLANEPKAPVKEKTLDDFTQREIFKHLYKLGYRLKDPKGLYCIIKQPVNLEDIICNG